MAKIEKYVKIKGYGWRVIDSFKTAYYFKTYREALAYILQ